MTGSTWQQAANDTVKTPAAQVTHEVSENDMRTIKRHYRPGWQPVLEPSTRLPHFQTE